MTDDFGRCLEAAISAEIAGGGSSYVLAALARFRDAVRAANTRVSAPAPVMESPSTKPVSDMSGAGAGVDLEYAMTVLRQLAADGCDIERALLSHIEAQAREIAELTEREKMLETAVTDPVDAESILGKLGSKLADLLDEDDWANVEPYLNRALLENYALRTRAEAAEKDAARYRWIRQSKSDIEGPAAYAPWCGPPLFDAALDAAIDAARKEGK